MPGSYFYSEDTEPGSTEIGAVIVSGVTQSGNQNSTTPSNNQTEQQQLSPSPLGQSAALLGGVMYLLFQVLFLLGCGGAVVTLATVSVAGVTKDQRYADAARFSATLAAAFGALGAILLVLIAATDYLLVPTAFSLLFLPSVFASTLFLTIELSLASSFVLWRLGKGRLGRSIAPDRVLAIAAAILSAGALASLNLANSFTLTPSLPQGAAAIVVPDSLGALGQLAAMVNRGWFPLSAKLLLAGAMSFAVLLSGMAVLAKAGAGGLRTSSPFDFMISWGFKAGIAFGAPLGILGYWNAAIMHTTTPVLAMGLMGKAATGFSSALISVVAPLWDIGIIGAMSLGGLAVVFYAPRAGGWASAGSEAGLVLRKLLPWFLILLGLGVFGTMYVGEWYPGQYVLSIYVLLGGFLMVEAIRRYAMGRLRLVAPVALFALACYGLIAYMAPYTDWYLASNFGGICWPLLGFPLLVLIGSYAAIKAKRAWYSIPVIAALLAPLVIVIKSAEVEMVKGAGIMAVDPTIKGVLEAWAAVNKYDLSAVTRQYYVPTATELVVIIGVAYGVFSLVLLGALSKVTSYGKAQMEELT